MLPTTFKFQKYSLTKALHLVILDPAFCGATVVSINMWHFQFVVLTNEQKLTEGERCGLREPSVISAQQGHQHGLLHGSIRQTNEAEPAGVRLTRMHATQADLVVPALPSWAQSLLGFSPGETTTTISTATHWQDTEQKGHWVIVAIVVRQT